MVDHIVSVDDNYNFPPQVLERLDELIQQRAKEIADGNPWVDIALAGWTNSSSNAVARYRVGGEGEKAYLELRGSVTSDGTTAIGAFTDLESGTIPITRTVYGIRVNSGENQSIRVNQSGLSVTTAPVAGVTVSLDGIKVYL